MLVIAQHTNITDPTAFWAKAQSVVGATPAGTSVLSVFPSQDGKTGTCIWEAGSADQLQQFLDTASEGLATNYCYEVNEAMAIGLPERKKDAVLNRPLSCFLILRAAMRLFFICTKFIYTDYLLH